MRRRTFILALGGPAVLAGCTGSAGDPEEPNGPTDAAEPTPPGTPTETDVPEATDSEPAAEPTPDRPELSDGGPSEGRAWIVSVDRVIDGRTLEVTFPDGATNTIRLLGVYTPKPSLADSSPDEFGLAHTADHREHLVKWGKRARTFTRDEIEGQEVRIELDPAVDRRGGGLRMPVFLYAHGELFNRWLLVMGFARTADEAFSKRDGFDAAERAARLNRARLWDYEAFPTPEPATDGTDPDGTGTGDDVPRLPPDGDYDCGDFDTREQAQTVLDGTDGDPHRLDADGDGVACEGLS